MSFSSLGLAPSLVQAANVLGFTAPTPIQTQAIPIILQGRDLLATAQTGSGKTAAFALPLLQRLPTLTQGDNEQMARAIRTLIVVPTRELATQVAEVIRSLAQTLPKPPKVIAVAGGVSINPQMMALRGGADVLVATPGRLLDLAGQNAIQLSTVRLLVLDEGGRNVERPRHADVVEDRCDHPVPVVGAVVEGERDGRLDRGGARHAAHDVVEADDADGVTEPLELRSERAGVEVHLAARAVTDAVVDEHDDAACRRHDAVDQV